MKSVSFSLTEKEREFFTEYAKRKGMTRYRDWQKRRCSSMRSASLSRDSSCFPMTKRRSSSATAPECMY